MIASIIKISFGKIKFQLVILLLITVLIPTTVQADQFDHCGTLVHGAS